MSSSTDLRLRDSIITVFGPPGSGKTNFMKWLLRQPQYRRHIVFDPMKEYDSGEYNVYRPSGRRYDDGGNAELNDLIDDMVISAEEAVRPRFVVVDEANRTIPNRKDPGPAVADLIDFNRHFATSLVAVARRPSQLNTDLENLSNHIFVFGGRGKNDYRSYSDTHRDLPQALEEKEQYQPVYVSSEGDLRIFDSVPNLGETPTL